MKTERVTLCIEVNITYDDSKRGARDNALDALLMRGSIPIGTISNGTGTIVLDPQQRYLKNHRKTHV